MTPLESLLLELIPVRLSPTPKASAGPSEQWEAAERQKELWRLAGECVSDAETVEKVERMAKCADMAHPRRLRDGGTSEAYVGGLA